MKLKYLITGATGFIGSHLLDYLMKQGVKAEQIRLLVRDPKRLHRQGKFSIVVGNLEDKNCTDQAIKNVDIIYHLAALSGFGGTTLADYRKINVYGTRNLLESIGKKKISKFVFFSTIAVYGLSSTLGNILGFDESHPHTYTEIYGQSKEEAEMEVLNAYRRFGIPYTIIRPASVYGPRDLGQLFGVYNAIDKGYFFFIGSGRNLMDFVYVEDLIKGSVLAEKHKSKTSDYILASGNPVEFNQIAINVAKSIHKKSSFVHIPKYLALPTSYASEALGKLLGKQLPLFPSRVRIMTSSYYYSIAKARNELGYHPSISLAEGTQKTGAWYKAHV